MDNFCHKCIGISYLMTCKGDSKKYVLATVNNCYHVFALLEELWKNSVGCFSFLVSHEAAFRCFLWLQNPEVQLDEDVFPNSYNMCQTLLSVT